MAWQIPPRHRLWVVFKDPRSACRPAANTGCGLAMLKVGELRAKNACERSTEVQIKSDHGVAYDLSFPARRTARVHPRYRCRGSSTTGHGPAKPTCDIGPCTRLYFGP